MKPRNAFSLIACESCIATIATLRISLLRVLVEACAAFRKNTNPTFQFLNTTTHVKNHKKEKTMQSLTCAFTRAFITLAFLLCLTATTPASAMDRYVPSQYPTIQHALVFAWPGDTIVVADGTYTGWGYCNVDFLGKPVTVRSASGDPTRCIIDCQGGGRGFVFLRGESRATVVSGLTIRNGYGGDPGGGGMLIVGGSPTIINCIFSKNRTARYGGAIYSQAGSPAVTNCVFRENSADTGGAIYTQSGNPAVTSSVFTGNTAAQYGGGIANTQTGNPNIANCTFNGNRAITGGGIWNTGNNPTIATCAFVGNSATSFGGGMANESNSPNIANSTFSGNSAVLGGGMVNTQSRPIIINCVLWGDTGGEVSNMDSQMVFNFNVVQGGYLSDPSAGNLDADPRFFRNPFTNGPTDYGDLRLQPDSPCINVGDNYAVAGVQTDLDGNPRICGGTVDLGAFERPVAIDVSRKIFALDTPVYKVGNIYKQTVILTNMSKETVNGPFSLVLDKLSSNASLSNKTGITQVLAPLGSPYLTVPIDRLGPGKSILVYLEFTGLTNEWLYYRARVLSGLGMR